MSRAQAREAIGRKFAGHIHNGSSWITGTIRSYCDEPTVQIEREDGELVYVPIGTIGPFLVENKRNRPTQAERESII